MEQARASRASLGGEKRPKGRKNLRYQFTNFKYNSCFAKKPHFYIFYHSYLEIFDIPRLPVELDPDF
jgi:hypothetical protein